MSQSRRSIALVALVLFALLGAADGVYLTLVHIDYALGRGDGLAAVCHQLTEHGCTVTMGRFGSIASIPISIIGFAGSLAIALLAVAALLRRQRFHDPLRSLLLVLASVTVLASLAMAGFSFVEGSFCPFCVAWYGINLGILISAYLVRDRDNVWQDYLDEALGTAGFVALGVFVAAVVLGLWAYRARREVLLAELEQTILEHAPQEARRVLDKAKQEPRLENLPLGGTPVEGAEAGPGVVEIVEFSDFQCPFCKNLWAELDQVLQTSEVPVRIRFVHFPLSTACNDDFPEDMHPLACDAAAAAQCAHLQAKFWDYGALLFDNQPEFERDDLIGYAEQLGLDVAAFTRCLDDPETERFVEANIRLGQLAGVSGTPTFFIDGYRIVGGAPAPIFNQMIKLVAEERADQDAAPAADEREDEPTGAAATGGAQPAATGAQPTGEPSGTADG